MKKRDFLSENRAPNGFPFWEIFSCFFSGLLEILEKGVEENKCRTLLTSKLIILLLHSTTSHDREKQYGKSPEKEASHWRII